MVSTCKVLNAFWKIREMNRKIALALDKSSFMKKKKKNKITFKMRLTVMSGHFQNQNIPNKLDCYVHQ